MTKKMTSHDVQDSILCQRSFCNMPDDSSDEFEYTSNPSFTPEQSDKILECFNIWPADSLSNLKYFSQLKADTLVEYREQFGLFEKISDVQSVPGFGVLGLKKLCKAILANEMKVKKITRKSGPKSTVNSICHPRIPASKCLGISNVMALDLQQDQISWVHMDKHMCVLDWHQTVIFDHPPTRYDHALWHQKISSAVSRLPEADIYLLENRIYRYPSLRVVPFITALRIIESIVITLLNKDYQETENHNVHMMKPHSIAGHFNLNIGGERVSGQHIVRDIINRSSTLAGQVTVNNEHADYFLGLEHQNQESLSRALLLSILFYQKVVASTKAEQLAEDSMQDKDETTVS
ncbi:transcription elongation factor, mitochondrial-like isoform X2 [Lineus longissimus]|uniref:transcription elongation factor, mitochondrial-like isoform X2 n=1 Tax=Lineus longissimus TaxID=88925 RepID=UPI00315D8F4A